MYDVIIKNGMVIDGSGGPMQRADVAIQEEEVVSVGNLSHENAHKVIDAAGKMVCPGFVDVNNHSDTYWRLFAGPGLESLLTQGITTIVGGNCGSSLAPLLSRDGIKAIQKWADISKVSVDWLGMGEFLEKVENLSPALNFASLVGHSTLRRSFVGDEVRDISPQEMAAMKKLLVRSLKDGAIGLSTGLVYAHARLASSREIVELAEMVRKYDGVYTTHIRGEGRELIRAVEEAIRIAQLSGARLHISHLKAMWEENWPLMEEALNLVETARTSGVDVTFDVYPYTATGSVLYILLPEWVTEGGRTMMLSRLKDKDIRARVIKEMRESERAYDKISVSISSLNKSLNRTRITDIAKAKGVSVEDAVIDVLIAGEGRVITTMEVLSERNVDKAVINPFSLIATNGAGYPIEHKKTGEVVHPRSFGSFPRVLAEYVRARQVVSWEEAVHKMSGAPAERMGLKKRGLLAKGYAADVTIFDPEKVRDLATMDNPYQYAQGIEWVLVNGVVALAEGKITAERAGQVIRRSRKIFEL